MTDRNIRMDVLSPLLQSSSRLRLQQAHIPFVHFMFTEPEKKHKRKKRKQKERKKNAKETGWSWRTRNWYFRETVRVYTIGTKGRCSNGVRCYELPVRAGVDIPLSY